jgi:hypothetical protein
MQHQIEDLFRVFMHRYRRQLADSGVPLSHPRELLAWVPYLCYPSDMIGTGHPAYRVPNAIHDATMHDNAMNDHGEPSSQVNGGPSSSNTTVC